MPLRTREALAALLLVTGCAGGRDAAQRDIETLQAEVRDLREQNVQLARRLESLSNAVEALQARSARAAPPAPGRAEAIVPPDLAVVHVTPPTAGAASARPPPVPTAVPIATPDPARVEALARHGGRDFATEADHELKHARAQTGSERARLLEEFVEHYPRHPQADNALVESSAAWADVGVETQACAVARRVPDEYPAGDALPEALERLAWCERRQGARDAERKLLMRLVNEFPRTPAGQRAETRLAAITGRTGATPEGPARSGP